MIRAIIFDLDGTLADTEPLHLAAFSEVLEAEGIEVSRDDYFKRLIGYSDRDCFELLMKENRRALDSSKIDALIARKTGLYQRLIAERDLLYPGAAEFARSCAQRFPLMVATGTLRHEAELILVRTGLRELFVDIIAAEDVERGKPAPDVFLAALGRLGFLLRQRPPITNEECLVVEDTTAGIEAALAAGMRVLAIAHSGLAADLVRADVVRASLAETDLDDVLRQLSP